MRCDERDDRSINEINLILEQPEDLQDEITEQKMESTLNLGSGADVSLSKSGELLFPATATITESKNVSFNLEKAKLEAVFGKNVRDLFEKPLPPLDMILPSRQPASKPVMKRPGILILERA